MLSNISTFYILDENCNNSRVLNWQFALHSSYFLSHNNAGEAIDIDYELFIIWRETTIDITPMSTNSHQMSPSHHFSAINTKVSIVE